jgi:YfiH family protein
MQNIEKVETFEGVEVLRHGISVLSFQPWSESLLQGVTLSDLQGISPKQFDLGRRGEQFTPEARKNRRTFSEAFSGVTRLIVGMEQVHGSVVRSVNISESDTGEPPRGEWLILDSCDGLVTNSAGILLTATVADCVPVFLYDEKHGAIGLLHAGWRGTSERILHTGINKLEEEYGTEISELRVYLGPSIEKACYSVGEDVYRYFSQWIDEEDLQTNDTILDLKEINSRQAVEMGVRRDNVYISRYCTKCYDDMFFSYRASGENCGRMAAFIGLSKQIPS